MSMFEAAVFWTPALCWSLFQGWRGWKFQQLTLKTPDQNHERLHSAANVHNPKLGLLLFCLPDAFFHFVMCFAGFVALRALWWLVSGDSLQDLDAAGVAILIFLALMGLLGITGQLPHLIQNRLQGLPGVK